MSEEQTFSMEPVTNSENVDTVTDLSNEEKDSLLIGEQMENQQDELLAGKYKNAKDLETAYKELEKKLGEKSEPVSEEPESKNEPEEESSNDTEPNFLDQLWEEGTNNKLTKETFEKLKKKWTLLKLLRWQCSNGHRISKLLNQKSLPTKMFNRYMD